MKLLALSLLIVAVLMICIGCSAPPLLPIPLEQRQKISLILNPTPDTLRPFYMDSLDINRLAEELKKLPDKFSTNLQLILNNESLEILESNPTEDGAKVRIFPNIFRYIKEDSLTADYNIRGNLKWAATGRSSQIFGREFTRDLIGLLYIGYTTGDNEIAAVKYQFLIYDHQRILIDSLTIIGISPAHKGRWESSGGFFTRTTHYIQSTDNFVKAIKAANVDALRKFTLELSKKLDERYHLNFKSQLRRPFKKEMDRIKNLDGYK